MVVEPMPTMVKVDPETVATAVFELEYETANPELAVAVSENGTSVLVFVSNAPNVIVWFPFAMLKLNVAGLLIPIVLVAVTVTLELPAVVGVPVIAPEVVFNVNPAGNVPLARA